MSLSFLRPLGTDSPAVVAVFACKLTGTFDNSQIGNCVMTISLSCSDIANLSFTPSVIVPFALLIDHDVTQLQSMIGTRSSTNGKSGDKAVDC